MQITERDDDHLVAKWGHEIAEGASYYFKVDFRDGTVDERTYSERSTKLRHNVGRCRLVIEEET